MASDIKAFLRLQSADFLTALRDKVSEDILANRLETSMSLNGKSSGQQVVIPVADLAAQLADVLEQRGLIPDGLTAAPRMTLPMFC
jgi:hypothetical protein